MNEFWQKQEPGQPLFPNIVWNKPEQKSLAGKMLILGGNLHGFNAPGMAYTLALQAGAGECKVVMPTATRKFFGKTPPGNIEFVASTPSGSFGTKAKDEILSYASWADAILMAGDTGRNSETAILLEGLTTLNIKTIYTKDCVDLLANNPETLLGSDKHLIVASYAQLQKLAVNSKFSSAFTFNLQIAEIVKRLSEYTKTIKSGLITEHKGVVYFALSGKVITTSFGEEPNTWRLKIASSASVWWMQNPQQPFEAIASAICLTKI